MTDALCGPSNALSTFQKHTTVDRTLQQDRVASRQQFEQGFRSSPGPNAGILDAEFEAFQAGSLGNGLLEPQSFAPDLLRDHHAPRGPVIAAPSWAADFQSMHGNEVRASPVPQSRFRTEAPIHHTAPAGWHQDFMRHQSPSSVHHTTQQPKSGFGQGYAGNYNANFTMPASTQFTQTQQKQPERQQVDEFFDQEAMEEAFEAVSMEQSRIGESLSSPIDMATEFEDMYPNEEMRIGSDRILDEAMEDKENTNDKSEADELARTAGQLLDNLKHDQSQKFQQSSFLSLMRQLRDREVHVEGDKLVDIPQPLHPGGRFYPKDSPDFTEDHSAEALGSMKLDDAVGMP